MISAIIFDCFGVLTTDGWLAFKEKFFLGKPDRMELAMASNKRVDAGLISYTDFIHEIATLAGVTDRTALEIIEGNTPNSVLFDFIRDELKPKYKIGMLSNAGANWLDRLFETWQAELFDATLLSYEIGAIKPDPSMYETIATRLSVESEECIYIDDQQRYVEGAEMNGMKGICFEDTPTTILKIQELIDARTT